MASETKRDSKSASPSRVLATGPAQSTSDPATVKGEEEPRNGTKRETPHAGGLEGYLSDTGSYQSDSFDPALLDEEETPGGIATSTGTEGTKGKFAGGYNAIKSFNGQVYSGMSIGGSHTWNYQPGVWKETKKEPDLWEIDFQTNKVRNHKAPNNSGAPVGTEYHWYIVAHQLVKKVDANTYETRLVGSKYKLTHKNVNQKYWDVPNVKAQRDREMFLLDDAKRRVEGLPPVLSNEKVKVDKKEKGQATLGSFFGAGAPTPKKRAAEDAATSSSNKKAKDVVPSKKKGAA